MAENDCGVVRQLWGWMSEDARHYLVRVSDSVKYAALADGAVEWLHAVLVAGVPEHLWPLMYTRLGSPVNHLGLPDKPQDPERDILWLLSAVPQDAEAARWTVHGLAPRLTQDIVDAWFERPGRRLIDLVGMELRRFQSTKWETYADEVHELPGRARSGSSPMRVTWQPGGIVHGASSAAVDVAAWVEDENPPASVQGSVWLLCVRLLMEGVAPSVAGETAVAIA